MFKEQLQKHIGPCDWVGYLRIKPSTFFFFYRFKLRINKQKLYCKCTSPVKMCAYWRNTSAYEMKNTAGAKPHYAPQLSRCKQTNQIDAQPFFYF